jgi:hypothetical protein
MTDSTPDASEAVLQPATAVGFLRFANLLHEDAAIISEAATAIQLAAGIALGAGGLSNARQEDPGKKEELNEARKDAVEDYIKDLIRQGGGAGSSFAGCQHAYEEAVDAALETTEPGTPQRNRMMNAAMIHYVACLRRPKAKIVVPEE